LCAAAATICTITTATMATDITMEVATTITTWGSTTGAAGKKRSVHGEDGPMHASALR